LDFLSFERHILNGKWHMDFYPAGFVRIDFSFFIEILFADFFLVR